MSSRSEAEITSSSDSDFTKVTFEPDLKKFKMKYLDRDILDLMYKRVYDMAGIIGGNIKVFLNNKLIPIKNFSQYADMYLSSV